MELVELRKMLDAAKGIVARAAAAGIPKTDIAVIVGTSRDTVYRWIDQAGAPAAGEDATDRQPPGAPPA